MHRAAGLYRNQHGPPRRYPFSVVSRAAAGFAAASKIGEGATGEVFQGVLEGAPVAVKLLKLPEAVTAIGRDEIARRFRAELNVLAFYRHPSIVQLKGWAQAEDKASRYPYALVFELLEGGSLADYLRGADGSPAKRGPPLSPLARLDCAGGVGAALAFLHGMRVPGEGEGPPQPVLHRDVKSANVAFAALPGGALSAKVLDCGLAKAMRGDGAAAGASFSGGLVAGTVGYMAPEVHPAACIASKPSKCHTNRFLFSGFER